MNSCGKCRGTGTVVFFNGADVPCGECGGAGFLSGGNETAPAVSVELDALRKENTKLRNSLEYVEKVYSANCQSYRDEIASLKLTQPPAQNLGGKADAFDRIVAARKAYVDAAVIYNARLEMVREERIRGNWAMKPDREYMAMSEAQSAWHKTCQSLADAALKSEGSADV